MNVPVMFFKKQSKVFLFGLTAILLTFVSCDEPLLQVEFDMDFTTQATVPQSSGLNLPFDLFTPEVTTNSEAEFGINDTRKDLVEEVNLEDAKLTITSPSDQRFDFLEYIIVYIDADGLGELKIAEVTDVPDNIGAELTLEVADNDLSEYIKQDKFSLRLETKTDEFINDDIEIDIFTNFHVRARVIE